MNMDYANTKPIIDMNNIIKEFSGVRALNGIAFDVYKGEIHCLVGENGAGKSTLMKILSGAYQPTSGSIVVHGKAYKELTPHLSKELGINIVYQENDLVPTMNVVENVYVGNENASKLGFIDFKGSLKKVKVDMEDLEIELNPLQTSNL